MAHTRTLELTHDGCVGGGVSDCLDGYLTGWDLKRTGPRVEATPLPATSPTARPQPCLVERDRRLHASGVGQCRARAGTVGLERADAWRAQIGWLLGVGLGEETCSLRALAPAVGRIT